MPIVALPSDTIRAIGASQVLTDSASVVKELVDNALDARASAVFVEISGNALDVIQVKDNGYGISPADRNLVCKRHCTSKISSFEEISAIGGQYLGFRGEALASAAEMSGSMVVSTRVEGESTAVSLKIGRQGTIDNEERISHPVGTTVRVVDYLKTIPVRRQSALKTFARNLTKIKSCLQAYALARPKVRFSLKILKAKSDKGNWMYAPKPEASTMDAAIKVVGKRVTEQCEWRSWSLEDSKIQGSEQEKYRFECLLPRPQCDIASINNIGQFLSVDSRPVSSVRGTFKQIASQFKSYLRNHFAAQDLEKIIDPFMCFNIVCPKGSYDANIEPAKDDVLFIDATFVLEQTATLFKRIYGEIKASQSAMSSEKPTLTRNRSFDLLLARKQSTAQPLPAKVDHVGPGTLVQDDPRTNALFTRENRSLPAVRCATSKGIDPDQVASETTKPESSRNNGEEVATSAWKSNMYTVSDDDEEDLVLSPNPYKCRREVHDTDDDDADLRDVRVSNPWTIAKVNAAIHPRQIPSKTAHLLTPARQTGEMDDAFDSSPNTAPSAAARALPSPERTQRDDSSTRIESSSPERFPYPLTARKRRVDNSSAGSSALVELPNRKRYGQVALDTWVQKSLPASNIDQLDSLSFSAASASSDANTTSLSIDSQTGNTRPRDFVSARTLPTGTPLNEIPSASQQPGRRNGPRKCPQKSARINKPFVSPVNDPHKVWFDIGPTPARRGRSPQKGSPPNPHNIAKNEIELVHDSETGNVHPDLAVTLDYETRKAEAIQQRKAYLRQQALNAKQMIISSSPQSCEAATSGNSPYTNRYNKAIAEITPEDNPTTTSAESTPKPSSFEPGDARAYLVRLQRRSKAPGIRTESRSPSRARLRRKTAMLPLESIKEDDATRDLELTISSKTTNVEMIRLGVKRARAVDGYVNTKEISNGLEGGRTIEVVRSWEDALRILLEKRYDGEPPGAKVALWPVLQAHLTVEDAGTGDDVTVAT